MAVAYTFTKVPPINFPVLANQINNDANISVNVVDMSFDGASNTLVIDMASTLTGPQETELGVVVANHNGITKSFSIPFPMPLFDDFITSNASSALGWTSTTNTSGLFTMGANAEQDHPGVVRIGSGNLVTGVASYHLGLHDVVLGGGKIDLEFMLRLNQLGGALNQYSFRIGLGDVAIGNFNNGCWVEYNFGNSPNWSVVTSNGGVQTVSTSTTAVDVGWHSFSLDIAADGSSCMFFVDDAYISTVSTNLPANSCGPIVQLSKTLGLVPVNCDLDYFYFNKDTGRV